MTSNVLLFDNFLSNWWCKCSLSAWSIFWPFNFLLIIAHNVSIIGIANINKGIINEDDAYAWERLIKTGAGFEIKNTYYKNNQDISVVSTVIDCYKNEVITLDGTNHIISSSETPMRIIGDSFNWEWIYLVPGENQITVSGGCEVTIQWVEPIKIGNV